MSGAAVAAARNQSAKNKTKAAKHLTHLKYAVMNAPIFLCSTHGVYDVEKPLEPWTVPPRTFIFEAQSIGDLTLIGLDKPLWELLQGGKRWGFLAYLLGYHAAIAAKGFKVFDVYKRLFNNLILYKPGDTIHLRSLTIGGGRVQNATESSRKTYENMGFYRFDAQGESFPYKGYGRRMPNGSKPPYEILPVMHDEMVTHGEFATTDRDFTHYLQLEGEPKYLYNRGPIHNNFRRVWKAGEDPKGYKIIIFSSCAAVNGAETEVGAARIVEIANLQRERVLESWAMGLTSLSGAEEITAGATGAAAGATGAAAGASEDPLTDRIKYSLRSKAKEVFIAPIDGAIEFFSREDEDLGAALVAGGRRVRMRRRMTRRRHSRRR